MSLDAKGHGSEARAIPEAHNTLYFERDYAVCFAEALVWLRKHHTSTFSRFSSIDGNLKEIEIYKGPTRPYRMKINTSDS